MGWLLTLRKRRAAKRYARKLPKRLKHGWGFSEYYTPGQIKASVKKLKLNPTFIAIGYAAFLPRETYASLGAEMPVQMSYEEARALFDRYFPLELWSAAWEPAPENSYVMSGASYEGD